MRISAIVPIFNEAPRLASFLERIAQLPWPVDWILVDDGSTDETPDIIAARKAALPCLSLRLPQNGGKGAALRAGLRHADGDIIVFLDADLEYSPEDLLKVIEPIRLGQADVVYGSRFLEDSPEPGGSLAPPHNRVVWWHRGANRLLTWLSNQVTGLQLTDMETGTKAFLASHLQDLDLRESRFGIEPEITVKLARRGARFREVPIRYNARWYREGKKASWRDVPRAVWCILRYARQN